MIQIISLDFILALVPVLRDWRLKEIHTSWLIFSVVNPNYPKVDYSATSNISQISFAGNIFFGYGRTFSLNPRLSRFYLGGELFGRYVPVNVTDRQNIILTGATDVSLPFKVNLKTNFEGGLAVKAGYLIAPKTMFYILCGWNATQFSYESNVEGPSEIIAQLFGIKPGTHDIFPAIMPGLGIETMLTDKLSLRLQYVYSYYFVSDDIYSIDDVFTNFVANDYLKNVSRSQVTLDVTYHFNGL